jgi:ribosomal protein L2
MHGARWLPLAFLAQQGTEVANLIIAEKSAGFPRGNLLYSRTIGRGVPEVSITHGGALLRTAAHVNVVVNRMTSVTLLMIRGVSGSEHRPHRYGL